jgi:hypothetical protein
MCRRSLYIPRITSRFVYITRPLTGWVKLVNGAGACLFSDRGTVVVGCAREYAGGASPGTEGASPGPEGGYVDQQLGSKKAMVCCRLTGVRRTSLFDVRMSTIIL